MGWLKNSIESTWHSLWHASRFKILEFATVLLINFSSQIKFWQMGFVSTLYSCYYAQQDLFNVSLFVSPFISSQTNWKYPFHNQQQPSTQFNNPLQNNKTQSNNLPILEILRRTGGVYVKYLACQCLSIPIPSQITSDVDLNWINIIWKTTCKLVFLISV